MQAGLRGKGGEEKKKDPPKGATFSFFFGATLKFFRFFPSFWLRKHTTNTKETRNAPMDDVVREFERRNIKVKDAWVRECLEFFQRQPNRIENKFGFLIFFVFVSVLVSLHPFLTDLVEHTKQTRFCLFSDATE
jgi:hypothetical protein